MVIYRERSETIIDTAQESTSQICCCWKQSPHTKGEAPATVTVTVAAKVENMKITVTEKRLSFDSFPWFQLSQMPTKIF